MKMEITALLVLVFLAGLGWGQFLAERSIRKEIATLNKGRLTVSMPVDPDKATSTMGLLKDLMQQAEQQTKGEGGAEK